MWYVLTGNDTFGKYPAHARAEWNRFGAQPMHRTQNLTANFLERSHDRLLEQFGAETIDAQLIGSSEKTFRCTDIKQILGGHETTETTKFSKSMDRIGELDLSANAR
jgi:hypothetical protein